VIPIVLRILAMLALVGCSSLSARQDLSAPQEAQLAAFEGCADKVHVGYREMRGYVITIMLQQGLDLPEAVTGLEVVEELRSGRNVRGEVLCLLDNETGMHSCLEPKPSVAGWHRRQEEASPWSREYRHPNGQARSSVSC
jgi:hypothetical protein